MRKRTLARAYAVQVLYQVDITKDNFDDSLANFCLAQESPAEETIKEFTHGLVKGTLENLSEIDKRL